MSGAVKNMRAAMPTVAVWVDDLRAAFGNPVGIRATEAGNTVDWGKHHAPVGGRAVVAPHADSLVQPRRLKGASTGRMERSTAAGG